MKSLASRFILGSLLVAILVFAAAEYLTYRYARSVIEREIDSKVTLITQNTHCRITHLLTIIQEHCERTANRLIVKEFDRNASGEILRQTLKKNPTFYGMALALDPSRYGPFSPYYFKKGDTIVYRDLASPKYDYATKSWFTRPKEQQRPVWSEPYFDKNGGEVLMATFSDPIFDQQGFVGVVTVDLSLRELQRIVSSIQILQTGYAFLLSRKDRLIAYPDRERLMQPYSFEGLQM
jgi:sigma-B regulation protein RsbU (phosphoserine phosphatase)